MKARYLLAPEAASDLVQIWRYIKKKSTMDMADRVESVILDRIRFLAENPGAGHWRRNLTDQPVKFFPVFLSGHLSTRYQAAASCFHSAWAPRCSTDSQKSSVAVFLLTKANKKR
jgi:plasmid stabilization system protein ParE